MLLRLPRSQLISLQVLSGPSASKQPFTHTISLKTPLSSGIARETVCTQTTGVSLQFAYISTASTAIFDQQRGALVRNSAIPERSDNKRISASRVATNPLQLPLILLRADERRQRLEHEAGSKLVWRSHRTLSPSLSESK